ncbi:MAG: hypothetical protein WAL95_01040 [Candidatus Acidiferrales bacterium]
MKRLFLFCVAIFVLVVLFGLLVENPNDQKQKQAAIAAVKQNYRANTRLVTLDPDFKNASWSAEPLSQDMCTYDDCYAVILETYITDDGEDKPLEATWYVALKEHKYEATNRGARIYFEPSSP